MKREDKKEILKQLVAFMERLEPGKQLRFCIRRKRSMYGVYTFQVQCRAKDSGKSKWIGIRILEGDLQYAFDVMCMRSNQFNRDRGSLYRFRECVKCHRLGPVQVREEGNRKQFICEDCLRYRKEIYEDRENKGER